MASSLTSPPSYSLSLSNFQSSPPPISTAFTHCLRLFPAKSMTSSSHGLSRNLSLGLGSTSCVVMKASTLDFSSGSFFEGGEGFGSVEDPPSPPGSGLTALEDKEEPECPPGLRQYETMMVLRPDMSEDERLTLTQKYEELLVTGGGMYVEVFNRGVIPLAYGIKTKNKAGESNTYLDGIYLLFTYFTKPESIAILEATLQADDDVIRSTSFKIRKRKVV